MSLLSIGLYIHNYILNIVSGQIKQTSEFQKFFKAAFRNFFWLKMIQNQLLSKYTTNQCSKWSPFLRPIHNGKLVIFSNLSALDRFPSLLPFMYS